MTGSVESKDQGWAAEYWFKLRLPTKGYGTSLKGTISDKVFNIIETSLLQVPFRGFRGQQAYQSNRTRIISSVAQKFIHTWLEPRHIRRPALKYRATNLC